MKRKSQLQLDELEDLYKEKRYPKQDEMEDYAVSLGLTRKQVQQWFIYKRKRDNMTILPFRSMKKSSASTKLNATGIFAANENHKSTSSVANGCGKNKKKMLLPQDLLPAQYILKKVFRKDGPPLGVGFDSLPSQAFSHCKGCKESHPADQECEKGIAKRRKVFEFTGMDHQNNINEQAPAKKHGIGKGLMTVWRVVNPEGGNIPTGVDFSNREIGAPSQTCPAVQRKPPRNKRQQPLVSQMKQRSLEKKLQEKKRYSIKRREVQSNINDNQRQPSKEKCELALDGTISNERPDQLAMLVDDEELELRELQSGPNPLTCADHLGTSGFLGCSLCKDLLAKFPPNLVKMKQPFSMQPWDSSAETVKKLFKVFHFLYTYSVTLNICSFTLDEFAQAFHDKDSLLLGKIHVALLKFLLSDVQSELSGSLLPHFSLSCKFLALLQSRTKSLWLSPGRHL